MIKKIVAMTMLIGAAIGAPTLAHAQATVTPTLPVQRPWRIKLGGFFPTNGDVTDVFGRTFFSYGVSYDLSKTAAANPIVYSAYFDGSSRSRNGASVTYYSLGAQGRYYFNPVVNPVRTYAGVGLGAYLLNNKADGETNNDLRLGGKLLGGIELNNGLFAEADYTVIGEVRGHSPNGFNIGIGYRF